MIHLVGLIFDIRGSSNPGPQALLVNPADAKLSDCEFLLHQSLGASATLRVFWSSLKALVGAPVKWLDDAERIVVASRHHTQKVSKAYSLWQAVAEIDHVHDFHHWFDGFLRENDGPGCPRESPEISSRQAGVKERQGDLVGHEDGSRVATRSWATPIPLWSLLLLKWKKCP